jgi:hypothetical protein
MDKASSLFGRYRKNKFSDIVTRLKQKVIMRFDPNLVDKVPDNVMVSNWVPQQDILGKPRTRAQCYKTFCGRNLRMFVIT